MTRFGFLQRCGAALLALTFVLAVDASRAGLRPCPHHDQAPTQEAAHHASHDDGATQAPAHEDGPCSCIAGAQCSTVVAMSATSTPRIVVAERFAYVAPIRWSHQAPARVPHLFLPEATAPPVVL